MQDESTTQANPESTATPRTFTQAEVDKIVQSRLAEEAKKEREKARNEVKEWFGIPLEEAYKIVMSHQSQPASQQVAPTPKSTDDTPEWAKAVLSKVEKLEQELAQEKKAKRTSTVRDSAIKAGVLPELLDFLDPDADDPDTAISAMLEKQKAVLALAPKKPAPPTLHGATSQPTKAPSEPDIVDRETAQKILRGGSR